jgi:N-acetyl-1-D-myo-inositol-2-amino-2-deoxy-alpha-D-glucopyranoside deacetylase
MFVAAHPGDETRAHAATIAALHERGDEVLVLTATGEQGHGLRLGSGDALWEGAPPRDYDTQALLAVDQGEVAADIAAALIRRRPDVVVAPAADGDDVQARLHAATRTAADVIGVPLYVAGGHRRAGSVVVGTEVLTRLRTAEPGFADTGLGLRIISCVVAVLIGAFAGATLTAAHQAAVPLAGVQLPWGILVALAVTAGLLVGLRLVFDSRVVAGFAALGLLGSATVLALASAGGSVLVPGNAVGYAWTFGPVLIALLVLGWPRVPSRPRDRL